MAKMTQEPTKPTKVVQKEAIIQSLAAAASVTDACKAAGIDKSTYYDWLIADPEFKQQAESAKQSRIHVAKDVAFSNLLKSATDPRYQTSLIAWLNNEGGWSNNSKHELTGAGGAALQVFTFEIPNNGRD